ncbi:MAG: Minor capsid protein [Planctomycetes bacterium ADurb.Bin401]|nr:MAG: Minor capsid protein [Planctomycetes bacterium ADurb.Bin401]
MSVKLVIKDKSDIFKQLTAKRIDRVLFSMANDIQNLAKIKAPHLQGHLQSSIIAMRKPGKKAWMVEANMEYAKFQEFGGDKKRTVKNYTTPGTGKLYLTNSGKQVAKNALLYIKKELNAGF